MVRRMRAAKTKSRLREITLELSETGTDSFKVVRRFRERYPEIEASEIPDLVDLALMVLAGRIAVSNAPDGQENGDLFSESGYPDLIPVRVKEGNKIVRLRRSARTLTAREYFANVHETAGRMPRAANLTQRQLYHQRMLEMQQKGLMDIPFLQYITGTTEEAAHE